MQNVIVFNTAYWIKCSQIRGGGFFKTTSCLYQVTRNLQI